MPKSGSKELRIVTEDARIPEFPIRPEDIELTYEGRLPGAFGKCEVEEAAGGLILFFQRRRCWTSFSFEELVRFYKLVKLDRRLMLFGLLGPWFDDGGFGCVRLQDPLVVHLPNGRFAVTNRFIEHCAAVRV